MRNHIFSAQNRFMFFSSLDSFNNKSRVPIGLQFSEYEYRRQHLIFIWINLEFNSMWWTRSDATKLEMLKTFQSTSEWEAEKIIINREICICKQQVYTLRRKLKANVK